MSDVSPQNEEELTHWIDIDREPSKHSTYTETWGRSENSNITLVKPQPHASASNATATVTGEKTKGWFTNVLLALNIVALVVLTFVYYHANMTQDLKRYDLDFFIAHDFADLKTQVRTDHELIQAYGLQKAAKER